MKRKLTAVLLALLLALTLCSPALAGAEYGSFYADQLRRADQSGGRDVPAAVENAGC